MGSGNVTGIMDRQNYTERIDANTIVTVTGQPQGQLTWTRGKEDSVAEKVDHPAHYGGEDNPYEIIKIIEALGLGFHLGNVLKYIGRPDKGDYLEDLKKARWYLDRKIGLKEAESSKLTTTKTVVAEGCWLAIYPNPEGDEFTKVSIWVELDWTLNTFSARVASFCDMNGMYSVEPWRVLLEGSTGLPQGLSVRDFIYEFPPSIYNYYLHRRG